jgi:hypothetical protein
VPKVPGSGGNFTGAAGEASVEVVAWAGLEVAVAAANSLGKQGGIARGCCTRAVIGVPPVGEDVSLPLFAFTCRADAGGGNEQ